MQSSLLPGLERLQPAAAGLLSTTVEAGGSRVFCSQAARPGISPGGRPLPSNTSPAAPPLRPKFWSSCWPGRGCNWRGAKDRAPQDVLQDALFASQTLSAGEDGGTGPGGNQVFPGSRHVATVRSRGKQGRHLGCSRPRNPGCFSFIFWGGCWGPKGKGPSQVPKAVQKGTQGLGHSCFPKCRSASKSGGQGLHLCVLPVWGPRGGSKSGKVSRGTFSSVLQTPQACWAPLPSGEPGSIPLLPGNRLYVSLPRYT